MAASVRTWLVVAALACALTLLLRSADAQAAGPTSSSPPAKKSGPTSSSSSPSPAKKPVCVPGATSPCRVGALLRDPENQEEGTFNMKARAPSGAGDTDSDDDYSDADEPKDPDESSDDDLVVIGH
uniref:Uncharacterized protein n=1 Tax=Avena sativa TaxID=4498 RepID=A0ACD6ACQ9_AVESA